MEKKYPKLPGLIQKALNVEHNIGEGETWDEQFGGMARSIVQPLLQEAECRRTTLRDWPFGCEQALALARDLVIPWLSRP